MICIKDYLGKNITFVKGMTKHECEEHRKKYSKANGNSPWNTSFDAMALKTVIKAIIRDINKNPSIKLENQNLINKALQVDQSTIIDEEIVYIDNPNNNNVIENNTNFQQLEENISKLDNLVFKNE